MKGKIISAAIYGIGIIGITFILGYMTGSKPSQCKVLSYKMEAIDSFCVNLVEQAIESNCPADQLEEKDLQACRGIVAIRASQACEEMTGKADIDELMAKGC